MNAQELEHGRGYINGSDRRIDAARDDTRVERWFDDKRYEQCRVVNEKPVRVLAVLSKTFAVVRRGDDQRGIVESVSLQVFEHLSNGIIGIGNLSVVGIAEQSSKTRRRIVGRVRIVEVDPDKEGLVWTMWPGGYPAQRITDHLLRPALEFLKIED